MILKSPLTILILNNRSIKKCLLFLIAVLFCIHSFLFYNIPHFLKGILLYHNQQVDFGIFQI